MRVDQPRSETCRQIALAICDEVLDLEKVGIGIIQIDELASREGSPLRRRDRAAYLRAVDCFRLTASGVADDTQIHTHIYYAEFDDIMPSIAGMVGSDRRTSRQPLSRSQQRLAWYRWPQRLAFTVDPPGATALDDDI